MAMSPEERRARDAERKRKARAAERAARDAARMEARTSAAAAAPTTMRDAVDEALAHMKWLVPSDLASKAQARELAREIDELTYEGDRAKALSAHRALSRVLGDLGGTPLVRLQRELRSLRLAAKSEADDERKSDEGAATPANVTRFQRPPKRA